jgi:hypothetical protein
MRHFCHYAFLCVEEIKKPELSHFRQNVPDENLMKPEIATLG